jgi:hypothetical protein
MEMIEGRQRGGDEAALCDGQDHDAKQSTELEPVSRPT